MHRLLHWKVYLIVGVYLNSPDGCDAGSVREAKGSTIVGVRDRTRARSRCRQPAIYIPPTNDRDRLCSTDRITSNLHARLGAVKRCAYAPAGRSELGSLASGTKAKRAPRSGRSCLVPADVRCCKLALHLHEWTLPIAGRHRTSKW
jgi:hypothetical protein